MSTLTSYGVNTYRKTVPDTEYEPYTSFVATLLGFIAAFCAGAYGYLWLSGAAVLLAFVALGTTHHLERLSRSRKDEFDAAISLINQVKEEEISEILRNAAAKLEDHINAESDVYRSIRHGGGGGDLKDLRIQAEMTSKQFWVLHSVASKAGHPVKEDFYWKYLPKKPAIYPKD